MPPLPLLPPPCHFAFHAFATPAPPMLAGFSAGLLLFAADFADISRHCAGAPIRAMPTPAPLADAVLRDAAADLPDFADIAATMPPPFC